MPGKKLSKIKLTVPSKASKTDEKTLASILDELVSAQASVLSELDAIAKDPPYVDATKTAVDKQLKISQGGRAAELKDLAKAKKKATLHTNPSKLKRMVDDFNKDIAAVNGIAGSVHDDRNKHFAGLVDTLSSDIEKAFPATVTTTNIGLSRRVDTFVKQQGKKGWKSYTADAGKFRTEVLAFANDVHLYNQLRALNGEEPYKQVAIKKRSAIIEKGQKAKTAVKDVKKELQDAYDEQIKPSKGRWASYLELGSGGVYKLTDSGSYGGVKIHLTMSKDSWTSDADGKVSVLAHTPDAMMKKLLEVTDWKQLHATLEIGSDKGKYTHVFLFAGVLGNDTKWAAAAADHNKDAKWVAAAQSEMEKKLEAVKTRLKKKLKDAKDLHGRCVY